MKTFDFHATDFSLFPRREAKGGEYWADVDKKRVVAKMGHGIRPYVTKPDEARRS